MELNGIEIEKIKNDQSYHYENLIYQQGTAPPHFAFSVKEKPFLSRWIVRRDAIE